MSHAKAQSGPRSVRRASLALAVCCVGTAGCFHQTQAWPIALDPGSTVVVSFAQPRAVSIGNDSLLVMTGLSGRVQAFHADTLIVSLTGVTSDASRKAWAGRAAAFRLDSTTTVLHTEFEKGSIPFVIIAGLVGFYAFIGSLPP